MTNTELNYNCNLIFDKLFLIDNDNKSKEELIEIIKPILINLAEDQRQLGRRQVLNYMEDEIKYLRNKK